MKGKKEVKIMNHIVIENTLYSLENVRKISIISEKIAGREYYAVEIVYFNNAVEKIPCGHSENGKSESEKLFKLFCLKLKIS